MAKSENKTIGNTGESRAADFLKGQGYAIVERNWRTKTGEVDIIARKNDTLVFVEVKTWPNGDFYDLEQAVNAVKQHRIIKTAKSFMAVHKEYNNCYVRFDVLAVDMPGKSQMYHIENAFSETI